jgi:hypothetical protein
MQTKPVTVLETEIFRRQADALWNEEERLALVDFLARNPESGDIIPGTGGVRKMRWSRPGMGKRGGARVVYFYYHADAPLYAITVYAKADRADMTADEKKAALALTTRLKQQHPSKRRI